MLKVEFFVLTIVFKFHNEISPAWVNFLLLLVSLIYATIRILSVNLASNIEVEPLDSGKSLLLICGWFNLFVTLMELVDLKEEKLGPTCLPHE